LAATDLTRAAIIRRLQTGGEFSIVRGEETRKTPGADA